MTEKVKHYFAVTNEDRAKYMKEEFKGETIDIQIKFPKGLGAEHPFNFEDVEKLCKKYGVINAILNKTTNAIVTDFKIILKNPNAETLIDMFIHDTNFHTVTRSWVKEGLGKGNGFMELDLDDTKIRVMNANAMFVRRNKKGKVLGYNQWTKPFKNFDRKSTDLIPFKPNQIAHLMIDKVPNEPYGIGIVWSNERIIENLIQNEQDLQKLISRKAGAPYDVTIGQPGEKVSDASLEQAKSDLQFLSNRTEWVHSGDVVIKSVDFKDLGASLTDAQMYFFRMLLAGTEMPEVMMGNGQLNEGIAETQRETFNDRVRSIQKQVQAIIEEQIIRPLMKANGFDERPIFVWELPSEKAINERITVIKEMLTIRSSISMPLKASLEIELAKLMELEDLENVLMSPKDALKKDEEMEKEREEEETEIPQPEVPSVKPAAREKMQDVFEEGVQVFHKPSADMDLQEWTNLKEMAGFNYSDYLVKILEVLKTDKFVELSAITEADIANGLLSESGIEKLRVVLKDGFKNNKTIREIETDIMEHVGLKDRMKDGKLVKSAMLRPNAIARTETVRLANKGLINLFKENKIKKVRWIAALSDRTCPICMDLSGQVFEIDTVSPPPAHVNCRCSLISIAK